MARPLGHGVDPDGWLVPARPHDLSPRAPAGNTLLRHYLPGPVLARLFHALVECRNERSNRQSEPRAKHRGIWYWVDAIGTALLALLLAFFLILPIQVAGARLTEGNRDASILFGISSDSFGIALAVLIFRALRFFFRPPQS